MNNLIFEANGRSGLPLLTQALDAGHKVMTFVRSREKLPADLLSDGPGKLTIVELWQARVTDLLPKNRTSE